MATIYKRTQRKPLPAGAVIVERRGEKWATWSDAAGKHSARLAPDGKAVLVDRPGYIIEWWEGKQRKRESVRAGDKTTAEQIAAEREKAAMMRARGLIDTTQERLADEGRRPLGEHLADYEAKLQTAGRNAQYVADTMAMLQVVVKGGEFTTAADVSADAVNRFAAGLKERGLSARRIQAHLAAVKGFGRWLAAEGKLAADPLARVKTPSPKSDRRMERRMLLPEEWTWLRSVTLATAAVWRGIPATERVALYATAVQTGLRAGELRSLTRGRLFLSVMRHSTIVLTMDTYGHLFPGEEAATIARLPSMMSDPREAAQATGTDDNTPVAGCDSWGHFRGLLRGGMGQNAARHGETDIPRVANSEELQPVTLSLVGDKWRGVSTSGENKADYGVKTAKQIMILQACRGGG